MLRDFTHALIHIFIPNSWFSLNQKENNPSLSSWKNGDKTQCWKKVFYLRSLQISSNWENLPFFSRHKSFWWLLCRVNNTISCTLYLKEKKNLNKSMDNEIINIPILLCVGVSPIIDSSVNEGENMWLNVNTQIEKCRKDEEMYLMYELCIFQAAPGCESTDGNAIVQRFFPQRGKMCSSCKAPFWMQLSAA